jgi:hypothetical protein
MTQTNPEALRKSMMDSIANPSEDIARAVLTQAGYDPASLEKTISTGTGLVAYDLQAPARNLYPVNTPIRNRLPRVGGGVGTATNWKTINSIVGSGYDATGWVPEGQRAAQMSYVTGNVAAAYATLGEEDAVTFEAINAARTFEDVQSTMSMRLLQKTMLKEEQALMGGNTSMQLGTPATPTLSAANGNSPGTLPAATYSVIVVALTVQGMNNSSVVLGVATSKTVTGADGRTFVTYGGSSNKSANATQAVTLGQILSATATPIQGALGYAWFAGPAGTETLQAITTLNSVAFSGPLTTSGQPATAVTADCSADPKGFDGILTTALKAGSGAYINIMPTGVAGTGSTLTSSGSGTVVEIDNMLESMWDTHQTSPSIIYVNSRQVRDINTKVRAAPGGGSTVQILLDPDKPTSMVAGSTVGRYFNPYSMTPNQMIPLMIHPTLPAGTIVGWAEDLPSQYQSNEVPNVAEVKVRQDYYAIDWPLTTRQRQKGVYCEEVLAVYAPFAMGVISNIAAG